MYNMTKVMTKVRHGDDNMTKMTKNNTQNDQKTTKNDTKTCCGAFLYGLAAPLGDKNNTKMVQKPT